MGNTHVRRVGKVGSFLILALVIGVVLAGLALPAFATATATSFVNIHNVLATQGKAFQINVNNGESTLPGVLAGQYITEVRVFPPIDLIDAVLDGSVGAAGLTDVRVIGSPPAEIRFRTPTWPPPANTGIAPGANATFTINTLVADTLNRDRGTNWSVGVRGGADAGTQGAVAAGEGLATTIRVLQVQDVTLVAPTGATDDRNNDGTQEVTGTQGTQDTNGDGQALGDADDVCVRTSVYNAASVTLDVTPGLEGSNVNVGQPRPASGTPCSGAPITDGFDVASGATQEFDFPVSFGNVGADSLTNLTGTASAPNATTPATTDPDDDVFRAARSVIIEPKAAITYVANSLQPRAVRPSRLAQGIISEQAFTLRINKGNGDSPPLDTVAGQFASAFCNADATAPTSLGEGTQNNQNVTYESCQIADIADGRYRPEARFGYTDANGLVQPVTAITPQLEQVRLDSLIPDIKNLAITPPASAVTGATPAVSHDDTAKGYNAPAFSAAADVTDVSPETGQDTPCGTNGTAPAALPCTLVAAELVQYPLSAADGGGTPLQRTIDVRSLCSLSATGRLSCNIDLNGVAPTMFDTGVLSTALRVTVEDEVHLPATDISPLVDVDIVFPEIVEAAARRGGTITVANQTVQGQRRTIQVAFNEPVQNSNNPQDWRVQEGGETIAICSVQQSEDKRTVSLVTCAELPADPTGVVTYDPSLPGSSPYHDRVDHDIDHPEDQPLLDRIEPLAPFFDSVNGRGLQDGKFYFNTTTVEVVVDNGTHTADDPGVADGYTVEVFAEGAEEAEPGYQDGQEGDPICSDVAQGTSVTLTCNFGAGDREEDVYAISTDANGNEGSVRVADFVLDTIGPVISAVAIAGTQITVTFNEGLSAIRGRNDGGDWNFLATSIASGERERFQIGSVTAPANTQRVLSIQDTNYSGANYTPDRVRYRFDGFDEAMERYEDRAGNKLADADALFPGA